MLLGRPTVEERRVRKCIPSDRVQLRMSSGCVSWGCHRSTSNQEQYDAASHSAGPGLEKEVAKKKYYEARIHRDHVTESEISSVLNIFCIYIARTQVSDNCFLLYTIARQALTKDIHFLFSDEEQQRLQTCSNNHFCKDCLSASLALYLGSRHTCVIPPPSRTTVQS